MQAKRWMAVLVGAAGIGTASACPFGVVPQGSCVANSAAVFVAEPVVVSSVVPLAAPQVVVQSPVAPSVVAPSAVVVAAPAPMAAVAVSPTVVRQRVVVRNFGLLRTRVRW